MIDRLVEHATKPLGLSSSLSLQSARQYIDERFQEPLRITAIARRAGMSPATFSRKFRKLTGKGLGDYLQERRLQESKRLLKVSYLPISQISRQCGFLSDNYFRSLRS